MSLKIIGVQESSGEYQGKKFSGLRLHVTGEKRNTIGHTAENVYIKLDNARNLMSECSGDLSQLIGLDVEVLFDQYGKVCKVEVV